MMHGCRFSAIAILGSFAFLISNVSHALPQSTPDANRPNILLILTDDQRPDTIAALGNPVIKTPNLDRLAKRGLSFDRAYVQGSMQGAVCVPARAMLLSGRNLFRVDEKLLRDRSWPEVFAENGYATWMSGKWHNGPASIAKTFQRANSVFLGGMTDPMKTPVQDLVDGKLASPRREPNHACEQFADECIRTLETLGKQESPRKPFFYYLPMSGPHDPHIVPEDFPVHYDPASIPLPPNFQPLHPLDNGEMTVRDERLLPWPRSEQAVRQMIADYYRYVSYVDHQVGRVLDALEASPMADNTIVVFTSDSGVARGSHGLIGKQNLYEHSVRVPLIFFGPGIAENRRTHALCYALDILPTLARKCGIPNDVPGEYAPLNTVLENPDRKGRDRLLLAYRDSQRAITTGRWKLIRYPRIDRNQLFDLESDPHESNDLAGNPEHASRIAELRTAMESEMRESGDSAPLESDRPQPALWKPPVANLQDRKANIVFILADDLGYTDTGCYGSSYYETPHIDRLASQGMRLLNHHHCPNCTPTRAALMSGQYGARTGVYTVGSIDRFDWSKRPLRPVDNVEQLPLDRSTVAEQLRLAGYATGMFGKWHIGNRGPYHPGKRGFDQAIVSMGAHFDFETNPETPYPNGQYLADFLTDRAVDFIERHQDRPFFLYLPHFSVHSPHDAKPEWKKHFQDKPGVGGHKNPTYAAMIASLDESVGRILKTLDDRRLSENTIVLFASDNGGVGGYVREGIKQEGDITDNAPLRSGKGSLYEGGIRVPLIARWPGVIQPSSTSNVPTIHVDVFPTLLEIAGAPKPSQVLDGESLLPVFQAGKLQRTAIYQHFPGYLGAGANAWRTTPGGVIQEGPWKLIEYYEDDRTELYHLEEDPGETRNLRSEKPELASAMKKRLASWRASVKAPMPVRSPQGNDGEPQPDR
ncbi:MAG: sulfatase-like hydrolase/transferase [Planctomycetota bacterium]